MAEGHLVQLLPGMKIIAAATNRVVQKNDPTAHAEIIAIREAASLLKTHDLSGCTIYSSCEPCPMCLGAIYWAGIKRVVYGCDRNDAENAGFNDKLIYNEIMLPAASRRINFLKMEVPDGKDVFKAWTESENKIPY